MTEGVENSPLIADRINPEQQRIEAIGDQLRLKISSKIQTSTFLAGFAAAILSIQITLLWQESMRPRLLPVSIAFMAATIVLYVMAILRLDALTMPKRFWDEDETVKDPVASRMALLSEQDLWNLRERMIFHWNYLTLVATGVAAISLITILLPLEAVARNMNLLPTTAIWLGIMLIIVVVYLAVLGRVAQRSFKPLMRPED